MMNWYDMELGMKDRFDGLLRDAEKERYARLIEEMQNLRSERRSPMVNIFLNWLPILLTLKAVKIHHG